MQSDITQLQSGESSAQTALKTPLSQAQAMPPSGAPKGVLAEGLPPQFSLESVDSVIAEGVKQEKQKRLVKISIIIGALAIVLGAAGFAGYKWLLPALKTESSPSAVIPPPSGVATPPEPTAPLQPEPVPPAATTTAPTLPNSLVAGIGVTKQVDLELEFEGTSKPEIEDKIHQEAILITGESTTTLELFPRLAGESSFLDWQRFLGMFAGSIAPSSGLGVRFSIIVDKKGRALVIENSDETAATAWLDAIGTKMAVSLDFLFKEQPAGEFSQFRQGRAINGVRLHRFATNSQGLAIDYGFAGQFFIVSTSIDTFTNLARVLSSQ